MGTLPLVKRGLQSRSVRPQDVTNVERLRACYKSIFSPGIDMPTVSMNNILSLASKYVQNALICMFCPNPALQESIWLQWFCLRRCDAKCLRT